MPTRPTKNFYYFSLDVNYPIPLKKQASVVLGNDSKIIDEKYLWEGDFDSFCKKP